MPIYKKNGKAVLFVHIPKAAGTSIDRVFLSNGWQVAFQDGGGRPDTILRHLNCSYQHFHADLLKQVLRTDSFDAVFTVLRNPLDRLKSEYRWRKQHSPAPIAQFEPWVLRMLAAYKKNPFVLDNHIRPQSQFILPNALISTLEDGLENTMNGLEKKLGETFKYDASNISNASVAEQDFEISRKTRWVINMFYRRDFALHKKHLKLNAKGV